MELNSVNVDFKDDQWWVRVVENGTVTEKEFVLESHARSWASGQKARLSQSGNRTEAAE
ncbi:hypothetical protein [Rhizobium sp. OAE497]|uniref:hypothetical protein n=1 Tax=unclassified Rhizobium TaxID=2613769 RepID=UPI0018F395E7